MKFTKPVYSLIILIMVSCGMTNDAISQDKNSENKNVAFSIILQNEFGGPNTPEIQVIKEPKALQQFYSLINRTRKPGFALPKIDFTKEMVIVLCMGEKREAGNSISIVSVKESEKELQVLVSEKGNVGKMSAMVITQPFNIVKLPLTLKKIVFKKQE